MLIVSRGYYSLTYLFSYLLISRRCRVPTQSVVNKEAKSLALGLALRVVALTPSLGWTGYAGLWQMRISRTAAVCCRPLVNQSIAAAATSYYVHHSLLSAVSATLYT